MESPCRPADIWNEQKGDRMLGLKQRMVRAVLMLLSAITAALQPDKVALRPVAVPSGKSQARLIRRRK